MLEKLTKQSQPFQLILFVLFLAAIWLPGAVVSSSEVETSVFQNSFLALFERIWTVPFLPQLLGLILTGLLGIFFSVILYSVLSQLSASYAPAFLVVLWFALFKNPILFDPILLSQLFLLIVISLTFTVAEEDVAFTELWYASVFIGIAIYFFAPALFFVPWLWTFLLFFRKLTGRLFLISLLGVLTPLGLLWLVAIIKGDSVMIPDLIREVSNISFDFPTSVSSLEIIQLSLAALVLIISIGYSLGRPPESVRQGRGFILSFLWMMIWIIISSFLYKRLDVMALGALPVTFFILAYVIDRSRNRLMYTLLLVLLGVVLFRNYALLFTNFLH